MYLTVFKLIKNRVEKKLVAAGKVIGAKDDQKWVIVTQTKLFPIK